jgi:hypothetical protein
VKVRAEGTASIGKLSIFFEMYVFEGSSMGKAPRVNEEILVGITIPADSDLSMEPTSDKIVQVVESENANA